MLEIYETFHESLRRKSAEDNFEKHPTHKNSDIEIKLIDKWTRALGGNDCRTLNKRLKWDDLTSRKIQDIAEPFKGESLESERVKQNARRFFQEIRNGIIDFSVEPCLNLPFIHLWLPGCAYMKSFLKSEIEALQLDIRIDELAYSKLMNSLLQRISTAVDKVLMSEFNKRRTPGIALMAQINGLDKTNSAGIQDEYYRKFIKNIQLEGLNKLNDTYPYLSRRIGQIITYWIDSSIEMLSRISDDKSVIQREFDLNGPLVLHDIEVGCGDSHNKHRTVVICELECISGQLKKIVYKPRCLGLEKKYNEALLKINSWHQGSPFKTLLVVNKNGYGYCEYLSQEPCSSIEQLNQFYFNLGQLTAILHVFGAVDCHYENLIAHGNKAVLIDAETLFQPEEGVVFNVNSITSKTASGEIGLKVERSVLRTGILPGWLLNGEGKSTLDVSVLARAKQNQFETDVDGWISPNTDGMIPGKITITKRVASSPAQNHQMCNIGDFSDSFMCGFREEMESIVVHKALFTSKGGLLDSFQNVHRRIILRSTNVYGKILNQLTLPVAQKSKVEQGLMLEQLARAFINEDTKSRGWPIYLAEVRQLEFQDIPSFTHTIDSVNLPVPSEGTEVRNFFAKSGLETARMLIDDLNYDEVAFQLNIIKGSISCISSQDFQRSVTCRADFSSIFKSASKAEIGKRLFEYMASEKICAPNGEIGWLGHELTRDNNSYRFTLLGDDLYSGVQGICLLDSLLSPEANPDDAINFLDKYNSDIINNQSNIKDYWWKSRPLGMGGAAGILWSLYYLGQHQNKDLSQLASNLQSLLLEGLTPEIIYADQFLDVLTGCSGLVGYLLRNRADHTDQLTTVIANHLIAQQDDQGGWPTVSPSSTSLVSLTGFSHGAAGIIASLAKIGTTYSSDQCFQSAKKGLNFESLHFSVDHKNWVDLRVPGKLGFMNTWCAGAPGIALGRACLYSTKLWNQNIEDDLNIALSTTIKQGIRYSDDLCCGNYGIASILNIIADKIPSNAYKQVGRVDLAEHAIYLQDSALSRAIKNKGFITAGSKQTNQKMFGMFNGLSGIALAEISSSKVNGVKPTMALMDILTSGLI